MITFANLFLYSFRGGLLLTKRLKMGNFMSFANG
jgi:hypothetical protein